MRTVKSWTDGGAPDDGSRRRWSAESAPEVRQSDLARMLSVKASRGMEACVARMARAPPAGGGGGAG